MTRLIEIVVFPALAVVIHLLLALRMPVEDGADAGGSGGDAMVSIEAASAQVETMVSDWEETPETEETPEEMRAPETPPETERPEESRPDAQANRLAALERPEIELPQEPAPEVDRATVAPPEAPRPDVSEVAPPPDAPQEVTDAPTVPLSTPDSAPSRSAAVALPQQMSPTTPDRPEVDTAPPPPPERARRDDEGRPLVSRRPAQRPDDLEVPERRAAPQPQPEPEPQRQAQRAEQSQQASQAQQGQRAAGQGGSSQAGTTGRSQVKTLSQSQITRLTSVWGGRIRAQIERRKPRNTRGSGRVVLRITVARSGQVLGAGVARSSGTAALDQAAMRAVSRAGRMPPAPEGLTNASYSFNLPMDFN